MFPISASSNTFLKTSWGIFNVQAVFESVFVDGG